MAKNKGGRPKYEIDYKTLLGLCKLQCTGEECAAVLEVDYDTLNNRLKEDGEGGFSDFFKKHSAGGRASLRRRQFKAADDGNVTMLIWLGKQYLGQTDRMEQKQDEDALPIEVNFNVNAPLED